MKKLLTSIFLMLVTLVHAQDLIVHELDAPNATHYEDLEVLRPLLEDKQVVMLGEMTHMYENILEMKARVVKYLHEELGFTTLALETSMYDLWKIIEKPYTRTDLNWRIWEFWANSEAFQDLLDYVEENDIKIVGFDSQFTETTQFIDEFFEFCKKNKIHTQLDEDEIGIFIEDILVDYEIIEDDISFSQYKKELEYLIREIKKLPNTEKNYYWLQFTKNILSESLTVFYNVEEIESSDYVNRNDNFRDAQMADNLLTYAKRNPEEKIMVWTDNIHVIKDMSSYTQPVIKEFESMGTHISKVLGDKVYSLATIYANDSLYDILERQWFKVSIAEDSFEAMLLANNKDYLFVNAHQEVLQNNIKSRFLSYINFYEGKLSELYDGYVFLKTATLSKKVWDKENEHKEKNPSIETKEEPSIRNRSTKVFSGKLIDAKTKKPIPYVNVMLKDSGVYRLTDADGNYSIQISSDKNEEVAFSSMSYEEVVLPASQLKEVIALNSSFESLDEVILVGHSMSPKKVLQKAIQNIEKNYVLEPLNFHSYTHLIRSEFDEVYMDLEFISKNYQKGYRQRIYPEEKIEQVRWNVDLLNRENDKYVYQWYYKTDPIQFSSALHKRRYKKLELEFVISDDTKSKELYIIKFRTSRSGMAYTESWYPAKYSGIIYINKEDFAVIKFIQNWETTIYEENMKKYMLHTGEFKDKFTEKIEFISEYKKHANGKYYPSNYYRREHVETTNTNGEYINFNIESNSYLYDYTQDNIEVLAIDDLEENANLNRVKYNPEFWESFKPEDMMEEFWSKTHK